MSIMRGLVLAVAILCGLITARAQDVPFPSPEAHLGYRPGTDNHLVPWGEVVRYFERLDRGSDRVRTQVLGETTEGRPFIVAVVSSAATIANLDAYRAYQARLSDPRLITSKDERTRILEESKPVVVIACSIHSTETASTFMAMELAHELAGRDDPAIREILEKTILILIPSVNPDGVEKVSQWYERSKGHPWEGGGMPELYHKYAGHDTNRDWFMLNLKETQLVTRMLYREWFPTILYDVHQMGSRQARLFVPPFHDPVNPNLDPRLHQGIFMIGAHMAADLASAGKKGVLTNAMYDNWWNGGNRTTPQRHNIVAVLTEAASVRMASPIFLDQSDLRADSRGFTSHQPAVNFVDPWPGGWWRLRDIVDYELVCARSLLTLAARYAPMFQSNLLGMADDSIRRGVDEPPFAWIVPGDQRDPGSAADMVRILHDSGIEVQSALDPFEVSGTTYPAGTWILPASQPYRPHLKDLMERQVYPTRLTASGKAETPYDVAGWTLPLQMGVTSVEVATRFPFHAERLRTIERPRGAIAKDSNVGDGPSLFVIGNTTLDDFRVRNELLAADVEVWLARARMKASEDRVVREGELHFRADANARAVLERVLPSVATRVEEIPILNDFAPEKQSLRLKSPSLAIYQPWSPSMDEGWTRMTLEKYAIPYSTLHNAEIRAGGLKNVRVLLIPSIDTSTLKKGFLPNETEPSYVGGLGDEGVAAIRRFVQEGGRLVCLDSSTDFVIEAFGLPVKNAVKGLSSADFYAPGSILRAVRSGSDFDRVTVGMPSEFSIYFDDSVAFDTSHPSIAILARYASTEPLESGWLRGSSKIAGKAAIVEIPEKLGTIVLFGFRPQHRSQTNGTFRLLFNAILN